MTPNTQQAEAARQPIVGGQAPKRNEPCPCGSKLRFKYCHGDSSKIAAVQEATRQFANRLFANMIRGERMKKGLEPFPWTCTACGKGCLEPKESTIVPGTLLCPECDCVVEKTKMEAVVDVKN